MNQKQDDRANAFDSFTGTQALARCLDLLKAEEHWSNGDDSSELDESAVNTLVKAGLMIAELSVKVIVDFQTIATGAIEVSGEWRETAYKTIRRQIPTEGKGEIEFSRLKKARLSAIGEAAQGLIETDQGREMIENEIIDRQVFGGRPAVVNFIEPNATTDVPHYPDDVAPTSTDSNDKIVGSDKDSVDRSKPKPSKEETIVSLKKGKKEMGQKTKAKEFAATEYNGSRRWLEGVMKHHKITDSDWWKES